MTDFHWSEFAVPATLLIVFIIIAMATWVLHLLFPPPRVTPKTKATHETAQMSKPVPEVKTGVPHDETVSHVPPRP